MKRNSAIVLSLVCLAAAAGDAQTSRKAAKDSTQSGPVSKFFQTETPLVVTLTTNIASLRNDKTPDAPWRAATLSYVATAPDTGTVSVPARVRTRGIWRPENCQFPPLLLNVASDAVKGTELEGLDEPNLVNYCRNSDEYEQYVLQEFQLYRIDRLLTPVSHAVRLLQLTYADSATGKKEATRYAFVVEQPTEMAERLGAKILKMKGAAADDLAPLQSALVGLFQYMIGNTDFSFSGLRNAELLSMPVDQYVFAVYDFDFSGAVNATYATTDPSLPIKRVRDRLYRGYCVPKNAYPEAIATFNAKKDSIYALYRDSIGKLIAPATVSETLKYFDEFYRIINAPKAFKRAVVDVCVKRNR
jgi:hypothetical protein